MVRQVASLASVAGNDPIAVAATNTTEEHERPGCATCDKRVSADNVCDECAKPMHVACGSEVEASGKSISVCVICLSHMQNP
jgi:hypothetical protein